MQHHACITRMSTPTPELSVVLVSAEKVAHITHSIASQSSLISTKPSQLASIHWASEILTLKVITLFYCLSFFPDAFSLHFLVFC